jgi:YesN/AraC family two-component response regulator
VAEVLCTNSRYVTDCIKDRRGMTFTQFVNEYRVSYVQQLLRLHPDMKVFEAYTQAGFTSERSFFRIFKDVTGMTTTEWLGRVGETGE